jgi:hypothetical protein
VAALGEGWQLRLQASNLISAVPAALRVGVAKADGTPATLQPWLGMLGHAVVMREDGGVFSHVHPAGTVSMASQRLFTEREFGESAAKFDPNCGDLDALPPAVVEALGRGGEVTFPYSFPTSGDYRVWVQVRVEGKVRTAAYSLHVAPGARTSKSAAASMGERTWRSKSGVRRFGLRAKRGSSAARTRSEATWSPKSQRLVQLQCRAEGSPGIAAF